MDVIFRSEDGNELIWTPKWKDIVDITAVSKYIEETNRLKSKWIKDLNDAYGKIKVLDIFSKMKDEVAGEIASLLGNLYGDKRIDKIFPHLTEELKSMNKSRQIYYVLSQAKTLNDLKIRLQAIIDVHRKYLREERFRETFNITLRKLNLKLDTNLNLIEIR